MDRYRLKHSSLVDCLDKLDRKQALEVQRGGCPTCGGRLHRADYPRRIRVPGGSGGRRRVVRRISFCCERDCCRKRLTPPSLRFFGRRQYDAVDVLLASMAFQGLKGPRAAAVSSKLGIARRTLGRWCVWWRDTFLKSDLWSILKGRLASPVEAHAMPGSLFERIQFEGDDRVIAMLRLVAPQRMITAKLQR